MIKTKIRQERRNITKIKCEKVENERNEPPWGVQ